MNPLIERFPLSVKVGGTKCRINWDFRTVLSCNQNLKPYQCKKEIPQKVLLKILRRVYPEVRIFTEEHIEKWFWFLACGREEPSKKFPKKVAGINSNQPFDFDVDAELIYAGFLQQFQIDLQKENMHWWKFMILLENLGAETKLSKIMEYRTRDLTKKGLTKEERAFYKAMQKYYSLERKGERPDEKAREIEDALLRGEDITALLAGDND